MHRRALRRDRAPRLRTRALLLAGCGGSAGRVRRWRTARPRPSSSRATPRTCHLRAGRCSADRRGDGRATSLRLQVRGRRLRSTVPPTRRASDLVRAGRAGRPVPGGRTAPPHVRRATVRAGSVVVVGDGARTGDLGRRRAAADPQLPRHARRAGVRASARSRRRRAASCRSTGWARREDLGGVGELVAAPDRAATETGHGQPTLEAASSSRCRGDRRAAGCPRRRTRCELAGARRLPARCDAHALTESKRTFAFAAYAMTLGDAGRETLTVPRRTATRRTGPCSQQLAAGRLPARRLRRRAALGSSRPT